MGSLLYSINIENIKEKKCLKKMIIKNLVSDCIQQCKDLTPKELGVEELEVQYSLKDEKK